MGVKSSIIPTRSHSGLLGLVADDHTQYQKATTGAYAGDNGANRAIPHGLGVVPELVIIQDVNPTRWYLLISDMAVVIVGAAAGILFTAVTVMDATNFYVTTDGNGANMNTTSYKWVAIV